MTSVQEKLIKILKITLVQVVPLSVLDAMGHLNKIVHNAKAQTFSFIFLQKHVILVVLQELLKALQQEIIYVPLAILNVRLAKIRTQTIVLDVYKVIFFKTMFVETQIVLLANLLTLF